MNTDGGEVVDENRPDIRRVWFFWKVIAHLNIKC